MLFRGWWKLGRNFSMSPLMLMSATPQHESSKTSGSAAKDEAVDEDKKNNTEIITRSSSDTDLSISANHDSHSRQRQRQQENQLASLVATCSGNASADQLARHFRLWQFKEYQRR
ncbi:hypothetical protein QBC45DRAFT_399416 [Copromyces sp. CBS 386.78]|nr:hypothetical protein QBC45DRAFT_399416 [Copromyces sp. CBS 386.78]